MHDAAGPGPETTQSLLAFATVALRQSGSDTPRLDAEVLLGHVTSLSRVSLLAHPETPILASQAAAFRALVARREAMEPVAYLVGRREFYGRSFRVDRRALVPRPETELLVECGLREVAEWRSRGVVPRVVDVGTGSGAIAITVAAETALPIVATDSSEPALQLASENGTALEPSGPVRFVLADLLSALRGPLHVILANLPYLPADRGLPPDVALYEPHQALFGGPRGTALIERLLLQCPGLLPEGGMIALELDGHGQVQDLLPFVQKMGTWGSPEVLLDAAGLERVLVLRAATSLL